MKVVELVIENIKRVQHVTIRPTKAVTIIGGNNGEGKSSTIDTLMYVLGGASFMPEEPLRRGARKGFGRVELVAPNGDVLFAERRVTKKGSDVTVWPKDGEKYNSPQTILNALFESKDRTGAKIFFDPTSVIGMKPKERMELLKRILGISFDDLDAKHAEIYAERTGLGREVKLLEGQIAAMPVNAEVKGKEPVDIKALLKERDEANAHNEQLALSHREIEILAGYIADYKKEIESLRQRALELKAKLTLAEERGATMIDHLTEPVDTQNITDSLINAQELNDAIEANQRKREAEKQMRAKNMDIEKLTIALEGVAEEKEQRLASAKFPVPGLSFSNDGVLLNGLPFDQGSSAEQLRVCVAMGLAMHPNLRVLLVRDGSLLDENSLALLEQMAEENDAQVFLEKVGKGAECQIIIEDGMVVGE